MFLSPAEAKISSLSFEGGNPAMSTGLVSLTRMVSAPKPPLNLGSRSKFGLKLLLGGVEHGQTSSWRLRVY